MCFTCDANKWMARPLRDDADTLEWALIGALLLIAAFGWHHILKAME